MKRILLLGLDTELGRYFVRNFYDNIIPASGKLFNFWQPKTLENYLYSLDEIPDIIINAISYNHIKNCEKVENQLLVRNINVDNVEIIAKYCKEENIPLIHFSTYHVFDGTGNEGFEEFDINKLKPINFYGQTKLESEKIVENIAPIYLIFRCGYLYGSYYNNFVNSVIKKSFENEVLIIKSSELISPAYADDIVHYCFEIINHLDKWQDKLNNIYNIANSGNVSMIDFACRIIRMSKNIGILVKTKRIRNLSNYSENKLSRPLNGILNIEKFENSFQLKVKDWETALLDCLKDRFL